MCIVNDPQNKMIAIIPRSDGLYKITVQTNKNTIEIANTTSTKMSISDAHQKLGHIAHSAIQHAISKGFITGIEIDSKSKPNFCEACAKAKSACQPFPKESKTRAEHFSEHVHWDLWGLASVKSLDGYTYVTAHIDDTTRETKLFFQKSKSQTFESYKLDEANIETQTGRQIKISWSDRGGEFQLEAIINHQNQKGTEREFTVHNSPPQNGVAERGMRTQAE